MMVPIYPLACILLLVHADNDGTIASPASSVANELVGDTEYEERFSQCEFVKTLFGVTYDQLRGDKAPNLDSLTLVYRTTNGTQVFKMDTAAQALRQQRDLVDDHRLVIFVHGYRDSPTKEAFTNMTQVFLANGHTNLIALDASSVMTLLYPSTTSYVRFIGHKLGQVLAVFVQRHVDYYPNGGSGQPNCILLGCSHVRSWMLYAESVVNPLAFPAVRCKDWDAFKKGQCESEISYMGYPSKPTASGGHFLLQTGGKYPYGLGLNGTKYKKTSAFW